MRAGENHGNHYHRQQQPGRPKQRRANALAGIAGKIRLHLLPANQNRAAQASAMCRSGQYVSFRFWPNALPFNVLIFRLSDTSDATKFRFIG